MNTNSREGTIQLERNKIQGELEQMRYEWPQAKQPAHVTAPGRTSSAVWAAAVDTMLTAGSALMQMLREGAPSGESNFKRQML